MASESAVPALPTATTSATLTIESSTPSMIEAPKRAQHPARAVDTTRVSVGGGALAAAATVLNSGEDRQGRVRAALQTGFDKAAADSKCRLLPRERKPRFVPGAVPATLAAQLGVFRRAQTETERDARRGLLIGARFVLADSVREVRSSNGTTFRLFLSRGGYPGLTPVRTPAFPTGYLPANEQGPACRSIVWSVEFVRQRPLRLRGLGLRIYRPRAGPRTSQAEADKACAGKRAGRH